MKQISEKIEKETPKEDDSTKEENLEKINPLRGNRGFDKKVLSPREEKTDKEVEKKERPKVQRRINSNIDNVVINITPPKSLLPEAEKKEEKKEETNQSPDVKINRFPSPQPGEKKVEVERDRRDSLNMKDAITKISSQEKELEILNEKLRQKERENRERVLIDLVIMTTDIQFNKGVPINAPILFKAIEIWECFGLKKTPFPGKVTKAIRQLIEVSESLN